ncbi:hypothetical protein GCM10011585_35110 [Edaphobacter dinghuensis]|uniref:Uncharacterized protein n=1 Tax=Edaphobacter dinghuensis TaxID=1560005 RepID=A0A917MAJ8_9BACT|nr:hypothetical protein GCM10011585_35110 [Edaphobacter dinghuensis]
MNIVYRNEIQFTSQHDVLNDRRNIEMDYGMSKMERKESAFAYEQIVRY